jgi:hypothetical protein
VCLCHLYCFCVVLTLASPPLSLHNCLFSFMPVVRRESLDSVKARLVREQKLKTERRVQALLHPRDRRGEEEHDDSEEENKIRGRRALRYQRKEGHQRAGYTDKQFVLVFLFWGLYWSVRDRCFVVVSCFVESK